MADRITVTTGTVAGVQSPAGPRVARFIACGQTQFGPTDAPRVVRNLRDYLNTFGARSGGTNMYDAAEAFFNCGGGELVVQRAFGATPVNATIGLDSSKIVVTSRWPGAYYNAWTAAYTSATVTLTLVKGSRTVTYSAGSGGTAAQLQAAASVDPDVTVTVSSLPASNVAATNLASGTDDYANVNWTTVLGKVTPAVGPGCIAAPGVNGAASALATHAAANRRLALLTPGQTDSSATVISAQGSITAAYKQYATYVYPWVTTPDGTGGRKTIDGVGFAAGLRAVTQRTYGVGDSPLRRSAHQLVASAGVLPLTEVDDTTHTSLLAAGVATIRSLPTAVGLDVWATAEGVGANAKLAEAIFRDMVNAIADDAARLLDQFIGRPATASVLADAASAITGVIETAYKPYLVGGDGVGYKVAVSNGADPSDNRISAVVSLKFAEEIGFVDLTINAASADQSI
jgi:hypothetical protein